MRKLVLATVTVLFALTAQPALASVSENPKNAWQANATVWAIRRVGDTIYIGGEFTSLHDNAGHTAKRNHLAALDATTGAPKKWNPGANGVVYTIASDGNRIFVGGSFSSIGGRARSRIAAVDNATGAVLSGWNASANATVRDMNVYGNRIYVGGNFTKLNGDYRGFVGALSTGTGGLLGFRANADGQVRSVAIPPSGNILYIGGFFNKINGKSSPHVARVNTGTDQVLSWAHVPPTVVVIKVNADQVYIAYSGYKHTCNCFGRYTTSGNLVWEKHMTGSVQALDLHGGQVYIGGHFDAVGQQIGAGGTPRDRVASFFPSGQLTSWNPSVNFGEASGHPALGPRVIVSCGTALCIGGDFTKVNGQRREHFAMFPG